MPGKTRVPIPVVLAVGAVTVVALAAALLLPATGSDGGKVSVSAGGTAPSRAAQSEERPATPAPSTTFVTGVRQGESVSVERHRFEADDAEELFSYQEIQRYPPTQPAEPNRPELAVSPDGDQVAYSDGSSIRIHDLRSGATRIVVSGTSQGEHLPLRWSIPAMNTDPDTDGVWGIWAVGEPSWSPDGQYIAFHQGWWEGSGYGVVDLATGNYHATPGGSDFEWVDDEAATAVAGSFYTEPGRVHVSRSNRPADYRDVTERLPGPPERHYDDVAVSPDGRFLAVSWAEHSMGPPTCCAAIMRADGSDFRPLAVTGNVQSMAFTADGSGLYLVERQEGRTVIVLHRSDDVRTLRSLPGDLYHWDVRVRPDGRLGLLGRTALPYEGTGPMLCEQDCPPFRSRLLVADPEGAETLHESGDFDRDTAVDGFPTSIW